MADDVKSRLDENIAAAVAHHRAKQMDEAEKRYLVALDLVPNNYTVLHNLGLVAVAKSQHQTALDWFDRAVFSDPRNVAAHYNRAVALNVLDRSREAIEGFARVCSIEPDHYLSHRALGFLLLAVGDQERALDHFARTYELRRGEDQTGISIKSLTWSTRDKLLHDAEQFRYLSLRRRDRQGFEALARVYEKVATNFPERAALLSHIQSTELGENYNTAINITGAAEVGEGAVRQRSDRLATLAEFQAQNGAVAVDDLLTPTALLRLRRCLLESTIWHDFSHIGGFVASYLEDGLASPLLLQIVVELRRQFPDLLGTHTLSQAWAFKGLNGRAAIDIHADDAAVSVNFWITPNEANLTPDGGGLKLCLTPPPDFWKLNDYHDDHDRISSFLNQNSKKILQVPYRENRAVIFQSRLFHWSDAPEFREGFENRRINLTLLFGQS